MAVLNSVSSLSDSLPEGTDMNSNAKSWLQLYVDAVTEKDPYKRLALVQELRKIPRHDESEEISQEPKPRSVRPKIVRRRHWASAFNRKLAPYASVRVCDSGKS
jgi:hypothetical protein